MIVSIQSERRLGLIQTKICLLVVCLVVALLLNAAFADAPQFQVVAQQRIVPKLALAQVYRPLNDLSDYWVSEKLDGVRAYWNGNQLLSRAGNVFHAPDWFTRDFPSQTLDGELWVGHGQFEKVISTVRKHDPVDSEWRKVKYMVFDLPASSAIFSNRLIELQQLLNENNSKFIELIGQSRIKSHQTLMLRLDQVIEAHGEGLMLHHGDALYRAGRTRDILKVKRFEDAEAVVVAHLPGKGKYQKMLGAIIVETERGKRFRIGTGFSDKERSNPPPVGSSITYRFSGKTINGIPKFASFMRIRQCPPTQNSC